MKNDGRPETGDSTKTLDHILNEIRLLRKAQDMDASMTAAEAAAFVGMGEKKFNELIKAGVGPEYYDMPDGRRFTRRHVIPWRDGRFLRQEKWEKLRRVG